MNEVEENLEATAAAFEAFGRGDTEAVLGTAHPEIEIFMPPPFPDAGAYRGREGYLEWTDRWLEVWKEFEIEITAMTPVGSRHVVADAHQRGVGRASGIVVEQDVAYMTEVRDGRFMALHLYPSHADALAAAQAREHEPQS